MVETIGKRFFRFHYALSVSVFSPLSIFLCFLYHVDHVRALKAKGMPVVVYAPRYEDIIQSHLGAVHVVPARDPVLHGEMDLS